MKFLRITRAVVSFATSLHLQGLRAAMKLAERKVANAMRKSDVATAVHHAAQETVSLALAAKREARAIEAAVKADAKAIRTAIVAEADTLRRDHGLTV